MAVFFVYFYKHIVFLQFMVICTYKSTFSFEKFYQNLSFQTIRFL